MNKRLVSRCDPKKGDANTVEAADRAGGITVADEPQQIEPRRPVEQDRVPVTKPKSKTPVKKSSWADHLSWKLLQE